MALLVRLFDFTPGTPILSADVDSEFNQIVNILSGVSTTKHAVIKFDHAAIAVLELNQVNAGGSAVIQQWKNNGVIKASVDKDGNFSISALIATLNSASTAPATLRQDNATTGPILDLINSAGISVVKVNNKGVIQGISGNGAIGTALMPMVGQLANRFTDVNNAAGGAETDLNSFIIPGNTLSSNGEYLIVEFSGTFGGTTENRQVRLRFDGQLIFDTGLLNNVAHNNKTWNAKCLLIRTSATGVRHKTDFEFQDNGAGVSVWENHTSGDINITDFTGDRTVKSTGAAVTANNITGKILMIRKAYNSGL